MPGWPAALARHHERLDEIAEVLAKYGFAGWVQRGSGLVSRRVMKGLVDRFVDPEIVVMSDGERLQRALTELGTTWVKLGQILSPPSGVHVDVGRCATVRSPHPDLRLCAIRMLHRPGRVRTIRDLLWPRCGHGDALLLPRWGPRVHLAPQSGQDPFVGRP